MDEWNERTSFLLGVTFRDEDGALVVPTSATYRIDDVETEQSILAATAFPSLAATVDLLITPDNNAVINDEKEVEVHCVTIDFRYGSPEKRGTHAYTFGVRNLQFVSA